MCASNPWIATKAVKILTDVGIDYDFIDLNMGCPLDNICKMVCLTVIIYLFIMLQLKFEILCVYLIDIQFRSKIQKYVSKCKFCNFQSMIFDFKF